jgi:hypothetical protein
MTIRRLAEIRIVRKFTWRHEPPDPDVKSVNAVAEPASAKAKTWPGTDRQAWGVTADRARVGRGLGWGRPDLCKMSAIQRDRY